MLLMNDALSSTVWSPGKLRTSSIQDFQKMFVKSGASFSYAPGGSYDTKTEAEAEVLVEFEEG